jgi:hypothetical protein
MLHGLFGVCTFFFSMHFQQLPFTLDFPFMSCVDIFANYSKYNTNVQSLIFCMININSRFHLTFSLLINLFSCHKILTIIFLM